MCAFCLGDFIIKKDPSTDAKENSQNDANECMEADAVASVKPNDL